ncbi:bicaudal-D-related protein 2-like isoform X2 [Syngnathoides biaculeatus]|uniref:bicaudal-D-related protein 2-like isoform X2 n=1 Tax=Syngnathoides biaculeatus TaxID=300417 RepID=UPI002ADD68D9|nr:bicaudal-D-related protein 2-like isoform X2 [Syngnathoides biaculeatus]
MGCMRRHVTSSEKWDKRNRVQSRPAQQRATPRRSASLSEPEDDGPDAADGCGTDADPCILAGMSLGDVRERGDSSPDPQSTSEPDGDPRHQGRSESPTADGGESPFQRSYMTLPDLINGGRPLGRRRTLGHVNDTLKEVRREVELSRRRSIKLKAQVDKLQQSRQGPGWSQDRERVTEEILSILRLMQTIPEHQGGRAPELPPPGENRLDAALARLQDIARKMAVSGITKKDARSPPGAGGSEDGALLQQALRDRDDAIEKKKAMETELLRSKSEMMQLNNQLLEAAQKRLELSLELEAWKEDMQLLLQQQLVLQQQVEQSQKKTSRMGILRRNKAPVQRPANFPVAPGPASPDSPVHSPTFFGRPQLSPTWREKWKRGNGGRPSLQEAVQRRDDDGFHAVSLD